MTDMARMTAGRAALMGLVDRYLAALMDTSVSLLEVHQLMYFLQAAGEPLHLRFVKAPFGPCAENLGLLQPVDDEVDCGPGFGIP